MGAVTAVIDQLDADVHDPSEARNSGTFKTTPRASRQGVGEHGMLLVVGLGWRLAKARIARAMTTIPLATSANRWAHRRSRPRRTIKEGNPVPSASSGLS
jgi:hypothetical protein